jgi:SAM-dependent methyltransferase
MREPTWGAAFGDATVTAMQVYEDVFVPRLFAPWARVLLDGLTLRPGEAVLDVACGPGSVSRLAAAAVGPAGRVVGCDLSAAMLAVARGKPPVADGAPIEYHEAPADALPVPDATFDAAVCQQGLQFFPDRPAALAELRRALRPGGRLGVAVWSAIEESPLFAALEASVREVGGDALGDRYRAGPWGLPGAEELRGLLVGAGFVDVEVSRRALPSRFEGGGAQFASTLAASGIAADVAAFPPGLRARLDRAVARHFAPFAVGGAVEADAVSHVAFARRA